MKFRLFDIWSYSKVIESSCCDVWLQICSSCLRKQEMRVQGRWCQAADLDHQVSWARTAQVNCFQAVPKRFNRAMNLSQPQGLGVMMTPWEALICLLSVPERGNEWSLEDVCTPPEYGKKMREKNLSPSLCIYIIYVRRTSIKLCICNL